MNYNRGRCIPLSKLNRLKNLYNTNKLIKDKVDEFTEKMLKKGAEHWAIESIANALGPISNITNKNFVDQFSNLDVDLILKMEMKMENGEDDKNNPLVEILDRLISDPNVFKKYKFGSIDKDILFDVAIKYHLTEKIHQPKLQENGCW